MGAVYLGGFTMSGAVPGLAAAFATVGGALTNLKAVATAQASALASASAAIRIPAVADLQVQLDASLAIAANFSAQLADPAAYMSGLLTGLVQVQTSLGLMPPALALSGQIDAGAALGIQAGAKIAAVDLQLSALATIQAALNAAIAAVLGAINLYVSTTALLAAAGAQCFLYTGQVQLLGTELGAEVAAELGLPVTTDVRVVVTLVDTAANPAAVTAMNQIFRVS